MPASPERKPSNGRRSRQPQLIKEPLAQKYCGLIQVGGDATANFTIPHAIKDSGHGAYQHDPGRNETKI